MDDSEPSGRPISLMQVVPGRARIFPGRGRGPARATEEGGGGRRRKLSPGRRSPDKVLFVPSGLAQARGAESQNTRMGPDLTADGRTGTMPLSQ